MPNFDSGIYFLTVLAPIDNRMPAVDAQTGLVGSAVNLLRQSLQTLPTALQSKATEATGRNSPFAQSLRTHFTRFAIVDDVIFNGREAQGTLAAAAGGPNPIIALPVDRLRCPYLLWVAEFDAASAGSQELDGYLAELWSHMAAELREIFQYCWGFNDRVHSAADFAAYIRECQVETTMPFHDYWEGRPQLGDYPRLVGDVAAPVAAFAAAAWLLCWWTWTPYLLGAATIAFFALAGAFVARWRIGRLSLRPFPPPPNASLPAVLKALHLQAALADFAMAHQADEPEALHAAFAAFLEREKPSRLEGPTQAAGAIATPVA